MELTQKYLRPLERIEIPAHLQPFVDTSIDLLETSHATQLELPDTSVTTSYTNNTYRTYIERRNLEHHRDYEFVAVHLGQTSLMVCLEHRHDSGETYDGATNRDFARTTVAIQNGGAKLFHSNIVRLGPEEDITENEAAGQEMTSRLQHVFATIGLQDLSSREISYEQAS